MSTQDQLHAPQQAEPRRESNMEANHKNSQQGAVTTFDWTIPADLRSEATAQQSIRGNEFDEAYASGRPP